MRTLRIEFLIRFFSIRKNPIKLLSSADHLLNRIESLWFNRKQSLIYYNGVDALWNVIRKYLLSRAETII